MEAFLVEGYNKSDYITEIVNWEPLKYFETLNQCFVYMDSMKVKNYETRVRLTDYQEDILKTNEHWEIFFGV
nr:MAG: hypothetical protein [Caudoviricetes sp.]